MEEKGGGKMERIDAVHRSETAYYLHELSKRPRLCEVKISVDSLLDVKSSHLTG